MTGFTTMGGFATPDYYALTEDNNTLAGRRSKALTAQQATDVLTKTEGERMHNYIVVSLLTGARTEELRALT
jgi:hypothetical protein